jgi:hypothetical protein
MRENRNIHEILVQKPEGNRHLGRAIHKWKGSINMDLKETV